MEGSGRTVRMPAGVVLSVGDGLSVPVEVPVGVGLPTIKIDGLTVGGTATQ